MKIGIVCPYHFFVPGGVQEHIRAQANELERRGHSVKIITAKPWDYKQQPPSDVLFVGQSTRVRSPQSTTADVSISVDSDVIDSLLENEKFDILHFHEPEVPFLSRQLLARAKIPKVGTFHAAPPSNMVGRSFVNSLTPYVRSYAKLVDAITVVSPAAAAILGEDYTYHTISNGVDLCLYKPSKKSKDTNMILFVGRLEKRKGPKHLIDAYAVLKKKYPDLHLEIAGDGPLRKTLEQYCVDMEIHDVTFHGFISQEQKREMMARCGVFSSPALYGESFGIVVIEAMAMGATVVAGDNPGYATVMTDRGSISLVDPKDTFVFASRLELFLFDKELIEVWKKWSHDAIKKFDWPIVVDKYEKLYHSLLK